MIEEWKKVAQLCEQAARGALTLEEFHQAWPRGLEASALADAIFEDLEDGVEHFPGKFWSGQPDYAAWKASDMYRRILIDLYTVDAGHDESRLMAIRDALIAERDTPLDQLASRVAKLSLNHEE